ncbi:MAG: DMT family transporter [Microbacteriaceae bacterium]|nr:DMT family transporter [Microbacteriaceae bacterium]
MSQNLAEWISMNRRHPTLGATYAIAGALLFGINASTSKIIISAGVSPAQIVLFRSLATAAIAALVLVITNPSAFRVRPIEWPRLITFGVVGVALMQWAYSQAVFNLPVGIALLIEYTAIIWVPLVSLVWFRKKLSKQVWLGVGLVLIGLVIVSNLFGGSQLSLIGVVFAFLAAIFLTYYFIVGKQLQATRDTMSTLMYSMLISSAFWACIPGWSENLPSRSTDVSLLGPDSSPMALWVALIWLGIMGSFVPMWLSYRAMHHLTSTAAGIASTSETVFAFLFGMVLLGENFTGTQLVGGVFVLSGIVVAQLAERSNGLELEQNK